MSCACDLVVFPPPLDIQPGLDRLNRQIAGFPQLREALLHDAGKDEYAAALGAWSGTGPADLGVMLLEMWAYLGDSLSFYDEVHAHECYLRTARRDASVRDLVARLGYRPRPAVAATVELALLGDGRAPVTLPAGTAFRSAAFGDEPPQVFELDAELTIHPLRNSWGVEAPRLTTIAAVDASTSRFTLTPARSVKWVEGDFMLVQPDPTDDATWAPAVVTAAESRTDDAGERWLDVDVDRTVNLGTGRAIAGVRFLRPTRSVGLWLRNTGSVYEGGATSTLVLDGVHRDLRAGDLILVQCTRTGKEGVRWFRVIAVEEVTKDVVVATTTTTTTTAKLPATKITLDVDLDDNPDVFGRGSTADWSVGDEAWLFVHYGLRDAGRLGAPQRATLGATDTITLARAPTPVGDTAATRFALQDIDGVAFAGDGAVDFAAKTLTPTSVDGTRPALTLPATAFGNLGTATRGETVRSEVLGSGDATATNQAFTLAKSPLTFVPSATSAAGYVSTLSVRVDGVAWREATTFFGAGPEDTIFVVTVDGGGAATVTFGDGLRGARLPTGVDNVVATYRRGAGAAAPPVGSITQLARAAPGLRSVKQLFAGYGGADPEPAADIRANAPRQALTLGRAVSILDMEAFAAACAGVRAVSVRWAWDGLAQRPVVKVWIAGDGGVDATVGARLLAVSDRNTPIAVEAAAVIPITLTLAVTAAEGYDGATVDAAVAAALVGTGGALTVEALGIGRAVYFSRLYAAIHAVAGVRSVSLAWSRAAGLVGGYGDTPGEGAYFGFAGGVTLNGEVYACV